MVDTRIGVIGLGRMGGPIAERLAQGGYHVFGFDTAGTSERAGPGVTAASGVPEVVRQCEAVSLSLPHAAASLSVSEQIAGLADRRVETVVDLSTIGISAAGKCADILRAAGVEYVDAPLSGGVAGARTGKLAMMAAASPEALARVRDLLEDIAQNLFVVGGAPGQGQAMKLLNNYVSGTALAVTFEAVVFGARVGLDLEQMTDVLNASSGRTSASTDKLPRSVIPGTYDFGFAAEGMRKDIRLFLEGADEVQSPHRLAEASNALWQRFVDACPGTDFTYLHRYLEEGGS